MFGLETLLNIVTNQLLLMKFGPIEHQVKRPMWQLPPDNLQCMDAYHAGSWKRPSTTPGTVMSSSSSSQRKA